LKYAFPALQIKGGNHLMIILEVLTAFSVALLLSGVFALATRRGGRRTGLFWLFLIIFLATWAGGIWLRPFGPTLWGIHWLAFFLVGLVLALIIAVSAPGRPPKGRHETLDMLEQIEKEKEMEKLAYITLKPFFWVVLLALFVAIVIRYIFR
jgi:hypothetical protein